MLEIREYNPKYKKAILDYTKKTGRDTVPIELNLRVKNMRCLVAFKDNKFVGYIIGAPDPENEEIFFAHCWLSKDKGSGLILAKTGLKLIKDLGYKTLEFYRSEEKKYYREAIQ